ncbi:hypothetical protein DIPPA_21718 [Diplonema papillatum]|nr:hypothetical protein DIPPA_21718 [Diplonema papillatum]
MQPTMLKKCPISAFRQASPAQMTHQIHPTSDSPRFPQGTLEERRGRDLYGDRSTSGTMTMRLLSTPLRGFQRVLPTARQARGAVDMDPDDYHKQLRNRNEKARKVVKRILSKKPWRADVSSKYQDAETLKDREKKTDDLLYRMKQGESRGRP